MSSSEFEGGTEDGAVAAPAADGVAEADASAALGGGLREHMGAAQTEAKLRARTATSNSPIVAPSMGLLVS